MDVPHRSLTMITAVVGVIVGLAGCSAPAKSIDFCETLAMFKDRYVGEMSVAVSSETTGTTPTLVNVRDVRSMWDVLTEAAPAEIRGDVEAVRDAWVKQEASAPDNWVYSSAAGLIDSGKTDNIDTYVQAHCGLDYAGVVSTTTPTPTITGMVTPTPHIASPPSLTDQWTTEDGYSFDLTLDSQEPSVEVDVANAAPGEAIISAEYSLKGTLRNNTASHTAPLPRGVIAVPLWTDGAPVCGLSSNISYDKDGSPSSVPVCQIDSNLLGGFEGTVYPAAGVSTLKWGEAVTVEAKRVYRLTVKEDQVPTLLPALRAPSAYAVARSEGAQVTYCRAMSGGYYVSAWTAPTGCIAYSE